MNGMDSIKCLNSTAIRKAFGVFPALDFNRIREDHESAIGTGISPVCRALSM